jgi:hypothetical protein
MMEAMGKGIRLIDARNKTDFAKGYIPGSINIQGNNSFATWAGWHWQIRLCPRAFSGYFVRGRSLFFGNQAVQRVSGLSLV